MKNTKKIIIIVIGVLLILALIFLIYLKVAFISKSEVKDIIAANMNVNVNDLYFESIDLELDKGIYEVEVYYHNDDYEYKIDAKSATEGGRIIYTDFKYFTNSIIDNNNSNTNESTNNENASNSNTTTITMDEARDIALNHASTNINSITHLRTERDYENNTLVYEVDFIYNNYEYDYKIDAATGTIISYDVDSIYD
ncbi:MAG TPA: PepSY domain-containing protein [Candidatus Onthousia faecavium]|nr:PepSY domain-containing protein [Candidatus Onthousia faecavium]